MYTAARRLPGAQPHLPSSTSVEATSPAKRSVRSIRKRFESSVQHPSAQQPSVQQISVSAPSTPVKNPEKNPPKQQQSKSSAPAKPTRSRTQTKTQAELAAFLKAGLNGRERKSSTPSSTQLLPAANVGSLIEKWTAASLPRERTPLQERPLQQVDEPTYALPLDSVDTFGSASADIDHHHHPKTDPGRLESYAAHIRSNAGISPSVAAAADVAVSGDQSLKEIMAKGVHKKSAQKSTRYNAPNAPTKQKKNSRNPLRSDVAENALTSTQMSFTASPVHHQSEANLDVIIEDDQDVEPDSDWGAGDVYIRELFAEAEDTAERAVQCDENEDYFEAFELYWGVVDLYYKVIPFLTPEEGVDVHERIKMYTRRCEAIREAFEDDPEGADEIEGRAADATIAAAQKEEYMQENFNSAMYTTYTKVEHVEVGTLEQNAPPPPPPRSVALPPRPPASSLAQLSPAALLKPPSRPLPPSPPSQAPSVPLGGDEILSEQPRDGNSCREDDDDLHRTPYPDFANEKTALPDTSRTGAVGLSASTQAHRNSLSRPISRTAIRSSNNLVSPELVAEMQERVTVMQQCLNNFTVKRKHLGPARALELHVTTLNANTFGDLKKLAPLATELEHKWATELEVLLSMLQEIKEMRPGKGYDLREDIAKHLPALQRCDRSVRKTMRSFGALEGHVRYVERETGNESSKGGRGRRRWWVKVPVVEKGGLAGEVCQIVEEAEKEMRGVFKVCHEINVEVVKLMPVPGSFVESLPKHARSLIPRELKEGLTTWGMFKVSDYMKDRNLWHKDAAKEITSSLEKVGLIWEAKTSNKSFLSRTFDIRGERFHQAMTAFRRCQNAIRDLRREWPTMQHTDLDMAKIQNNDDIGLAGLEAYSRALESRAYRLLTRIRELLDVDEAEKKKSAIGRSKSSKKKEGSKRRRG